MLGDLAQRLDFCCLIGAIPCIFSGARRGGPLDSCPSCITRAMLRAPVSGPGDKPGKSTTLVWQSQHAMVVCLLMLEKSEGPTRLRFPAPQLRVMPPSSLGLALIMWGALCVRGH